MNASMRSVQRVLQVPIRVGAAILSLFLFAFALGMLVALVIYPQLALYSMPLAIGAWLALRICATDLYRERLPFTSLGLALVVSLWGVTEAGDGPLRVATTGFAVIGLAALLVNLAYRRHWSGDADPSGVTT